MASLNTWSVALMGAVVLSAAVPAADVANVKHALAVGDAPPSLTILEWLKGDPVTSFEKGHVYVVEFGATWCPPCRKAIPHMTELAKTYAGKVTMISVYASEHGTKENPKDLKYVDKIRYLMKSMGDKMDFPVAVDVPQQTTGDAWRVNALPVSFVIDGSGKIAWTGQPEGLDSVLQQIAAGTFQPTRTAQEEKSLEAAVNNIQELKASGNFPVALAKINALIKAHSGTGNSYLYIVKYQVLAGDDDAQAATLLKWILAADMPGFDWDHFVYDTYTRSKHPNYELALATVSHAIERAETPIVAASLNKQKIDIYLARSQHRSSPADAKSDVAKAAEVLKHVEAALSRTPGAPHDESLDNSLPYYQFRVLAGSDDKKANGVLRSVLKGSARGVDWLGYIDTALEREKAPDYPLLLSVADRALAEADQRYYDGMNAEVLLREADIYAAQGDLARARATYGEGLAAEKKAGADAESLKRFEIKLAAVQKEHTP
jgi:thiol-disulfide isomerase/thioredoxin